MNPKRQRILLLIMLVVLAGVVARRQFFQRGWHEDRNARQEERAERREAQQQTRQDRKEASLREREAELEQKDAGRDARQREKDETRNARDRDRDTEGAERGPANSSDATVTERGSLRSADAGFDRSISRISYSKHARCRMDCRKIDESEILEIRNKGSINLSKSDLANKRAPRYAVEGTTHDNQRVRIIFAQQPAALVVVTCIDLEKDWSCNCN